MRPAPVHWDLESPDPAVVKSEVSKLLKPFRLWTARQRPYDAKLASRRLDHLLLALVSYGDRVLLDAGKLETFSLLQIPVRGSFLWGQGPGAVEVKPGYAHLITPQAPVVMNWSANCQMLLVRYDEQVTRLLRSEGLLAETASTPLPPTLIDLHSSNARFLGRTLELLGRELLDREIIDRSAKVRRGVEDMLLEGTLFALRNSGKTHAVSQREGSLAACVADAERFIERQEDSAISIVDLARHCGVSRRTLYQAFEQVHGFGPVTWDRRRRLLKAREALTTAETPLSVTEAATRCGFNHLSRFAAAYKALFGESPSATLYAKRQRRQVS